MNSFISDLQQAIGLVLQSPVIEMVAGLVSNDQEITAEIVNVVRRGGDIAQLFISRINTTPGQISISQLPSIENKEGLVSAVHIFGEVVKQLFPEVSAESGLCKLFSEQNPDFDTEIFDAIVLLFKLVIFQLEKKLQKLPTNKIAGTTPVEDIIHQVGDITELFVSLIEGVLENVANEQIKIDSDVKVLQQFKSANELVVSETKRTLEEVVTNDQGIETIMTTREVFQVTRIEEIIQQFESDLNSGFQAWFRYNREALALLIGGLVSAYFGQTGATIASIITSILFDLIHTRVVEPKGVWCLMKSNKPEDMRNAVMTVVSDGLVGYAGGKFLETWIRSSEVDAIERVRAERTRLGLTKPLAKKKKKEVWTEIRDLKTGKKYYGTNKRIRKKIEKWKEEPAINLYVKNYPIKVLPLEREAETCAEMHAFHQMLEDRPDANVSKTPVCTFELLVDGTYKNITRCKNCMARELFMGNVPTDKLITDKNSLPQKGESREFYESYLPTPLWYCTEHTILTRAEYSKLIKQAILVYRQMKDKVDQN